MSEIKPLDPRLRDRLRSGVATVSVAQCVEELVLNSVDAEATCIAVRVDLSCGKIQCVDNGTGISRDNLQIVAERYATSKCHVVEDLDNLPHYGYRGEALASIRDSCLLLEISSRYKRSTETFVRLFKNGHPLPIFSATSPRPSTGTTVTVHDVLHSFPVRKKSLNESLELERIRARVEAVALMRPLLSISLRNEENGNKLLQTHKANGVSGAFGHLFGLPKARPLKEVSRMESEFEIQGYVSTESHYNKSLQFVYINKRLVLKTKVHKSMNFLLGRSLVIRRRGRGTGVSPDITKDVTTSPQKYSDRHCIYILNITCPLSSYDITFDPAKTLVEFHDWPGLLKCVERMVKDFLVRENLTMRMEQSNENALDRPNLISSGVLDDSQDSAVEDEVDVHDKTDDNGARHSSSPKSYTESLNTVNMVNTLHSESVRRPKSVTAPELMTPEPSPPCPDDGQYSEHGDVNDCSVLSRAIDLNDTDVSPSPKPGAVLTAAGEPISDSYPDTPSELTTDNSLQKIDSTSPLHGMSLYSDQACDIKVSNDQSTLTNSSMKIGPEFDEEMPIPDESLSHMLKPDSKEELSSSVPGQRDRTFISLSSQHSASMDEFRKLFRSCPMSEDPIPSPHDDLSTPGTSTSKDPVNCDLTPWKRIREKLAQRKKKAAEVNCNEFGSSIVKPAPDSTQENLLERLDQIRRKLTKNISPLQDHSSFMSHQSSSDLQHDVKATAMCQSAQIEEHTIQSGGSSVQQHESVQQPSVDKFAHCTLADAQKQAHAAVIRSREPGPMCPLLEAAGSTDIQRKTTGTPGTDKLKTLSDFQIPLVTFPRDSTSGSAQSSYCGYRQKEAKLPQPCASNMDVCFKRPSPVPMPSSLASKLARLSGHKHPTSVRSTHLTHHPDVHSNCSKHDSLETVTEKSSSSECNGFLTTDSFLVTAQNVDFSKYAGGDSTTNNKDPKVELCHDEYQQVPSGSADTSNITHGAFKRKLMPWKFTDSDDNVPIAAGVSEDRVTSTSPKAKHKKVHFVDPRSPSCHEPDRGTATSLPASPNSRLQADDQGTLCADATPVTKGTLETVSHLNLPPEDSQRIAADQTNINDDCFVERPKIKVARVSCQPELSPQSVSSCTSHYISHPRLKSAVYRVPTRDHGQSDDHENAAQSQGFRDVPDQQSQGFDTGITGTQPFQPYLSSTQPFDPHLFSSPISLTSEDTDKVPVKLPSSKVENVLTCTDPKSPHLSVGVHETRHIDVTCTSNDHQQKSVIDAEAADDDADDNVVDVHQTSEYFFPQDERVDADSVKSVLSHHDPHSATAGKIETDSSSVGSEIPHINTNELSKPSDISESWLTSECCLSSPSTSTADPGPRVSSDPPQSPVCLPDDTETQNTSQGHPSSPGTSTEIAKTAANMTTSRHPPQSNEETSAPGDVDADKLQIPDDLDLSTVSRQWLCQVDNTGRKMYINLTTGNTSFEEPKLCTDNPTKTDQVPKTHPLYRCSNSLLQQFKDRVTLPSTSKVTTSISEGEGHLSVLLGEHQGEQEVEDFSKWRSKENNLGDDENVGVVQLFEEWDNPVFSSSQNDLTTCATSSSKTNRPYQPNLPHTFNKQMLSSIKVLGQVDKKFIACLIEKETAESTAGDMLIIIDQHAAHERVRLENLIQDSYEDQAEGSRTFQRTKMIPAVEMTLNQNEIRVIEAYRKQLEKMGLQFSVDRRDRNIIQIHSIPTCLVQREPDESKRGRTPIAMEILETLQKTRGAGAALPRTVMRVLSSQACHGAIKFGDRLTLAECGQLVAALSDCDLPFQCAHGRPSIMPLLDLGRLQKTYPSKPLPRPRLWSLVQKMKQDSDS